MGADFIATAHGAKADEWREVFGRDWVNVEMALPVRGELPGRGIVPMYRLDLELMSNRDLVALAGHLTRKFKLSESPDQVLADMRRDGVPIPADEVSITIRNPQKWF